jgi:hypothetical protein
MPLSFGDLKRQNPGGKFTFPDLVSDGMIGPGSDGLDRRFQCWDRHLDALAQWRRRAGDGRFVHDVLPREMVRHWPARRLLPLGPDQQADGIGDDMASATFDLLARIIAGRPAAFCDFDRLAVDDPRRRARRATLHSASVTSLA